MAIQIQSGMGYDSMKTGCKPRQISLKGYNSLRRPRQSDERHTTDSIHGHMGFREHTRDVKEKSIGERQASRNRITFPIFNRL